MGRLGITNVLPLTGGQGITVIGNKINLGGEITNDIEIDIGNNEILLFQPNLYFNRIKASYVRIVDANTEKTAAIGINNASNVSLWASDNQFKETVIDESSISIINNGDETFTVTENIVATSTKFQNIPYSEFKLIDASAGTTTPDSVIEMEINGTTYNIPAQQV